MTQERPRVSIVVVVWRSAVALACLRALMAMQSAVPHEVIAVLNDVAPDTEASIRSILTDPHRVITSRVNLGFAGAANQGVARSCGDQVAFLHDDALVLDGWLEALLAAAGPGVAVVGSAHHGPGAHVPTTASEPVEVPSVTDCGMLVDRRAFLDIGGFDVGFSPAFGEDLDLCRRLRSEGLRIVHQPAAHLEVHAGGGFAPGLAGYLQARAEARLEARSSAGRLDPATPAATTAVTSAPTNPPRGSIDIPARGTDLVPGRVDVRGWALDPSEPLHGVQLMAEGRLIAEARLGLNRADVAVIHPDVPHAATCGWQATVDLFRSGNIELRAVGVTADRQRHDVGTTTVTVAREPGTRRSVAVFTIVKDESVFLPAWLRHYANQLGTDDIYVLDHDSTDGSTTNLDFGTVVPVHHDTSFDHSWLLAVVEDFQRVLLRSYDTVIFAEADELLIADPRRFATLADYVGAMAGPAARATGFNVVHHHGEPAWEPDHPLLEQRSWWHRVAQYDKTLISTLPLSYDHGFHTQRSLTLEPDPELLLLHLHRVDRDLCLARHAVAAARRWSAVDLASGMGQQSRVVDPVAFEEWFYGGPDLGLPERAPIPAHLRTAA